MIFLDEKNESCYDWIMTILEEIGKENYTASGFFKYASLHELMLFAALMEFHDFEILDLNFVFIFENRFEFYFDGCGREPDKIIIRKKAEPKKKRKKR